MASEAGTETVWQVALEQSKYWKGINPKACEPREGTYIIPDGHFIRYLLYRNGRNHLFDTGDPQRTQATFFIFAVSNVTASVDAPLRRTLRITGDVHVSTLSWQVTHLSRDDLA